MQRNKIAVALTTLDRMKIGTLTLHLPFNYGNALQMFSLHRYLREQGWDAEVLSHWYHENRDEILYWHHAVRRFPRGTVKFILNCLCWNGTVCAYMRECKLKRWLDLNIQWSAASGYDGHFPCAKIPHDVVIVGSDQIWNPIHRTSKFFLLPDFPDGIRKIAYAASMGTDRFVEKEREFFKRNLERFHAISVRESSAKAIIRSEMGLESELVCDPTLLHSKAEWVRLLGIVESAGKSKYNMAYFVTPDAGRLWRDLIRIARETKKPLHVFTFVASTVKVNLAWPFGTVVKTIVKRIRLRLAGVHLHFAATPTDFVQCLANCDGLFTDSFHGMMFATIFERKCNVVVGDHPERLQMSARLRNFTSEFGSPDILTPRMDVAALKPLKITQKLNALIEHSKKWLDKAVRGYDDYDHFVRCFKRRLHGD